MPDSDNFNHSDSLHDRFVRWQTITREQLSYSINLILAFAGATIGFEVTVLLNERFVLSHLENTLYAVSIVFLALSMVPGLFAVITRLNDFRATTRTIKLEWKHPEKESDIGELKALTKSLGRATWCLFYLQILAFGLGALFAAIVFFAFVASQAP